MNTKSFIANKINIIANAPVRYSYRSFARTNRKKLLHNSLGNCQKKKEKFIIHNGKAGSVKKYRFNSLDVKTVYFFW